MKNVSILLLVAICVSGCQIKSNHGRQIPDDEIHKMRTSGATKEDIIEKFGSPTVTSFYGQESWFYISRKQYYRAFFPSQVSSQEVVEITFNGNKLDKINLVENSHNNITPVREVTPTEGQNINFMRDFINNMGRFHKKKKGR
jgi:outer membrane protein assembly factor BamE (lipoprotein component of BamABCDE complex)